LEAWRLVKLCTYPAGVTALTAAEENAGRARKALAVSEDGMGPAPVGRAEHAWLEELVVVLLIGTVLVAMVVGTDEVLELVVETALELELRKEMIEDPELDKELEEDEEMAIEDELEIEDENEDVC